MKNRRAVGTDYEKKAAEYLCSKGYRILAHSFRCHFGEIDLIAKDGEYLVFIEVKYRTDNNAGEPQEAVGCRKQQKICRTAAYYCMKQGFSPDQPCRFDVAAIRGEDITIIKNAFEFCM